MAVSSNEENAKIGQKGLCGGHVTGVQSCALPICLNSLPSVSVPNLKFPASTVREILGGSQNTKTGSRDPRMTPFDLILHFLR